MPHRRLCSPGLNKGFYGPSEAFLACGYTSANIIESSYKASIALLGLFWPVGIIPPGSSWLLLVPPGSS